MKKILFISGKAHSGKDYVSELIKSKLIEKGFTVSKFALADELKLYLCILLGIDLDTLNKLKNSEEAFCKNGTTVRQMLQRMGTDIFFNYIDKEYWIKVAGKKCEQYNTDFVIISDFRYPHETDVCKYCTYKPVTVRINANNELIKSCAHPSEISLDDYNFDFYIDNGNYSLTENNVNIFIDNLIGKNNG